MPDSGYMTLLRSLDTAVVDNDITNTATETDIYSVSIPANILGTNKAVRLIIYGLYSANSGSPTVILKIYYGTTLMWQDTSFVISAVSPSGVWRFEIILSAHNATNSQEVNGFLIFGNRALTATVGNGDISATSSGPTHPVEGTAAENSTTALNFKISVTWSAANTLYHFNRKFAIAEMML